MKEVYLVLAHPETEIQKEFLRNIVSVLKKEGKTIMVSSHIVPPSDVLDKVDYSYVCKRNELLFDQKYKGYLSVDISGIRVYSKNFFNYNSTLAVYDILFPALMSLKHEGYNTVHFLEYDMEINSFEEFDSNHTKLHEDGLDFIIYNKHHNDAEFFMSGELISFNLSNLSVSDFYFDREALKEHIHQHKMGEASSYELFIKNRKHLIKPRKEVKGIKAGLHHSDKSHFTGPFIHDGKILIFSMNYDPTKREILVVFNGTAEIRTVPPNTWYFFDVGELENIKELDLYINKKLIKTYYYRDENEIQIAQIENIIEFF